MLSKKSLVFASVAAILSANANAVEVGGLEVNGGAIVTAYSYSKLKLDDQGSGFNAANQQGGYIKNTSAPAFTKGRILVSKDFGNGFSALTQLDGNKGGTAANAYSITYTKGNHSLEVGKDFFGYTAFNDNTSGFKNSTILLDNFWTGAYSYGASYVYSNDKVFFNAGVGVIKDKDLIENKDGKKKVNNKKCIVENPNGSCATVTGQVDAENNNIPDTTTTTTTSNNTLGFFGSNGTAPVFASARLEYTGIQNFNVGVGYNYTKANGRAKTSFGIVGDSVLEDIKDVYKQTISGDIAFAKKNFFLVGAYNHANIGTDNSNKFYKKSKEQNVGAALLVASNGEFTYTGNLKNAKNAIFGGFQYQYNIVSVYDYFHNNLSDGLPFGAPSYRVNQYGAILGFQFNDNLLIQGTFDYKVYNNGYAVLNEKINPATSPATSPTNYALVTNEKSAKVNLILNF